MTGFERVLPIHCIGESHCLRFRNRLFTGAALPYPLYVRVHFLQDLQAATFTSEGGLHEDLAAALVAGGLCVASPQPDGSAELDTAHRASTFGDRVLAARHAALADEPLIAPAMLLFAGDNDLHTLAMQIGPETDFELPDDPGYGIIANARRVPYHDVESGLARALQPFFTGLELLGEAGFARTLVHCLLPRVRDEERVARWLHGMRVPATVRSKLAIVGNRLLAKNCRRLGFGFVDVWSELSSDGFLDPRFDLDGMHCNHRATTASLAAAAVQLARLAAHAVNPAQYELLHELAVPRSAARSELDEAFVDAGHVAVTLRAMPTPWHRDTGLPHTGGHFAHPEWSGLAADVVPAAQFVLPGPDHLRALHDLLFAAEVREALELGSDFAVGICTVRSLRPLGPAAVGATRSLAAPAGARRALLVQHGALTVTCTPRDDLGTAGSRHLGAGALLVFDPCRVQLSCTELDAGTEVLEIGLLPRLPDEVHRVLSTGWNDWPCDPFRIPLLGQPSYPPVDDDTLRRWREIEGRTVRTKPEVEPAVGATEAVGGEVAR